METILYGDEKKNVISKEIVFDEDKAEIGIMLMWKEKKQ